MRQIKAKVNKGIKYGVVIYKNSYTQSHGHAGEGQSVETHHRTLKAAERQAVTRRNQWSNKVKFEVVGLH